MGGVFLAFEDAHVGSADLLERSVVKVEDTADQLDAMAVPIARSGFRQPDTSILEGGFELGAAETGKSGIVGEMPLFEIPCFVLEGVVHVHSCARCFRSLDQSVASKVQ